MSVCMFSKLWKYWYYLLQTCFLTTKNYTSAIPGCKLVQNKWQINVKLNSAEKAWAQFNYNIIIEINGKMIDANIH